MYWQANICITLKKQIVNPKSTMCFAITMSRIPMLIHICTCLVLTLVLFSLTIHVPEHWTFRLLAREEGDVRTNARLHQFCRPYEFIFQQAVFPSPPLFILSQKHISRKPLPKWRHGSKAPATSILQATLQSPQWTCNRIEDYGAFGPRRWESKHLFACNYNSILSPETFYSHFTFSRIYLLCAHRTLGGV